MSNVDEASLKLAEDRKARLLEAQSEIKMAAVQNELDLAVCENDILSQENTKLRHDVDKLKDQLENLEKKNLNPVLDDEAEGEVTELIAQNRQLQSSLEAAQDQNHQLSSQQTSLEEKLSQKNFDLREDFKNVIRDLREDFRKMNDELEREKKLRNSETEKSKFLAEKVSETKRMVDLLTEENRQKSLEIERLSAVAKKSLEEEFESRCREIREECLKESDQRCKEVRRVCKKEEEDALQEQEVKMGESVSKWKSDVATEKLKIEELKNKLESSEKSKFELQKKLELVEGKYELAKQKLSEIVERNEAKENALTHIRDQLVTKDAAAEKTLDTQLYMIKLQMKELAQNMAKSFSDVSKHPGVVIPHTSGRTKPSHTQSEASMPQRPPTGVGSLFAADNEDGEMFSSSSHHDLKDGRCLVGSGDINPRTLNVERSNVDASIADFKREVVTPEGSPRVGKRLRKSEESPAQSGSSQNFSFESPVMETPSSM